MKMNRLTDEHGIMRDFSLEIPERRLHMRLGYTRKTAVVPENMREMIRNERKSLIRLARAQSIFRVVDYEETNKHPIFARAKKVALCICTIGSEVEDQCADLMRRNEMVRSLILDSLGSEAAEAVAAQSDERLAIQAREENLWPSKRFSPGYGQWDIQEQRYLFQALPAQDIGVSLSSSCMMIPRKSVSFRINFYADKSLSTRRSR